MADGNKTDFLSASHWRTTPLVGVRVRSTGLMHGGEAALVVAHFDALSDADQAKLVDHVNSR